MTAPAPAVAAVHDLSCVGRCALTVVIPALAAMGAQPCPLPTAALSTHTGGYEGMAIQDLTGFMEGCVRHWEALGLRFDAIYSGYLARAEQAELILRLYEGQSKPKPPLLVVDPVMGDEGAIYSGIPRDMPNKMLGLCARADLITPNVTEASLLLGEAYRAEPKGPAEIDRLLAGLIGTGAKAAVVTGVPIGGGMRANALKRAGEAGYWASEYAPYLAHYPGAGDLFASLMVGGLLAGDTPMSAMARATEIAREAVGVSVHTDSEVRAGLQLERALPLIGRVKGAPPTRVEP